MSIYFCIFVLEKKNNQNKYLNSTLTYFSALLMNTACKNIVLKFEIASIKKYEQNSILKCLWLIKFHRINQ